MGISDFGGMGLDILATLELLLLLLLGSCGNKSSLLALTDELYCGDLRLGGNCDT